MTRAEFIVKMAEKGNIKVVEAKRITNLFIDTLLECLKENGKVQFFGFGNFEVKKTKDRKGRNPQTGDKCIIQKRKVVKFKASHTLTREMNK